MSEHICDKDLMLNHEKRITENSQSASSAHKRINGTIELFNEFKEEMKKNNHHLSELITNISLIAQEVKGLAVLTNRHGEDIADIKEKMETKEGFARLHKSIEDISEKQEKLEERIGQEENKEALAALEQIRSVKKWMVGSAVLIGTSLLLIGIAVVYYASQNTILN